MADLARSPDDHGAARGAAARVLTRVWQEQAFASAALDFELAKRQLDPRDAALATELVYGVLRTADSLSPIAAPAVAASLAAFAVVYFIVFAAGFAYLLRLMARPPASADSGEPTTPIRTAGIVPWQEGG